jgi:hypothetical protein
MKNVHLLPTEKPSRLTKPSGSSSIKLYTNGLTNTPKGHCKNYHLYITSDEEIKVDEYYLGEDNNIYCLVSSVNCNGKKIILTTDQELIEEGIQAIDDEFLEWFVKNPSCEFVEVKHFGTCCGNQSITQCINCEKYNPIYKITIPQEESKQDPTLENAKLALREYILANKEKVTEDLQEMREKSDSGRDETLEEAALSFLPRSEVEHDTDFITGFEFGANWMAERMYSEEELKNAIEISVAKALGVMSFTINEESFEQFKKK